MNGTETADIQKTEKNQTEKDSAKTSTYFKIAALLLAAAFIISFFTGLLPVAPVTVATGSMQPEVNIGDVVIVCKTNPDELKVGDIIQYQGNGFSVIHRIYAQKTNDNGETYFITKGDNNNAPDANPVTKSQVLGKVLFTVPYIGNVSLWVHNLFGNNQPSAFI